MQNSSSIFMPSQSISLKALNPKALQTCHLSRNCRQLSANYLLTSFKIKVVSENFASSDFHNFSPKHPQRVEDVRRN